jgi:hypothetical protein
MAVRDVDRGQILALIPLFRRRRRCCSRAIHSRT